MISRWAKRFTDPDTLLIYGMSSAVEAAGVRYALRKDLNRYQPGSPLKLLLAGYAGTRNTGGDVRVEEMVRQFRRILGDRNIELSMFTIDPALSAGYHRTVRQISLPTVFPKFLYDECSRHHGVVACEGSMFKSKFANALSTMMAGAMAIAGVEGKLSVGYGGEAGKMDEVLQEFLRKYLRSSLVICRNEASRTIMDSLGLRTTVGTDTAWTFDAAPVSRAEQILREQGWDGEKPIVVMAPVNPFWWPAKPDVLKSTALRLGGQYRADHYKDIVFHSWSATAEQRYEAYIDGWVTALSAFVAEHGAFPVLVGSERLDRQACEHMAERLPFRVPLLVSDDLDMYDLVAVLRRSDLVVSSRFHAIVNAMPAGVPSVAVTIDERLANLFEARGHEQYLLRAEDEGLGERLLACMRSAFTERDRLREEILRFLPGQLRGMAQMGMDFEDEVRRVYPDFPVRSGARPVERYLPDLPAHLRAVMERYA